MLQVLQLQCSKMESNLKKGRQMVLASLPGDIFPAALCRSRPDLQLPHLIGICPIHHITPNKESRQKQKVTKAIPPSPRYLYTYPCKCTICWGPLRVVNLDFLTLALILSPPSEPPFRLFYTFVTFWPFSPQAKIILQRIWVPQYAQSAKLSALGVPWMRNNRLILDV